MANHLRSALLLATCTLIVLICIASSSPQHRIHRRSETLCGKTLADALSFVCDGNFNGPDRKRHAPLDYSHEVLQDDLLSETYGAGFSSKSEASSVLSRSARGVVEECCKKSCGFRTLQSYCAQQGST